MHGRMAVDGYNSDLHGMQNIGASPFVRLCFVVCVINVDFFDRWEATQQLGH